MRFDIDKYNGDYVMHCKTEEEAKDFCQYLHSIGRKWFSGDSYAEHNAWTRYRKYTVYDFNDGGYANIDYYKLRNYTILEWEDFMKHTFTKADLKTGDVCKQRDGVVQVFIKEFNVFVTNCGWNDADKFTEDLTNVLGNDYDIVAVRRPTEKGDVQFDAFDRLYGTLVYERKDVEEMTLEQVCQLLGREIKIIK